MDSFLKPLGDRGGEHNCNCVACVGKLRNEMKELKQELETMKMVVGAQRDLVAVEIHQLKLTIRKMDAHVDEYKPERGQGAY